MAVLNHYKPIINSFIYLFHCLIEAKIFHGLGLGYYLRVLQKSNNFALESKQNKRRVQELVDV